MKKNVPTSFTVKQFKALAEEQRRAILAVSEYLTSEIPEISDQGLSGSLNLLKPSKGRAARKEIGDDLPATIRRKFAAVYETALELAEAELKEQGFEDTKDFGFCLVIEPSCEDTTHVAIVDYRKPICYLHEWSKAWHFSFSNLAELAQAVLGAKSALVNKVLENRAKELIIVVQDGTAREVVGLPPNTRVVVANYDIEDVEKEFLSPSPVDGELCVLSKF